MRKLSIDSWLAALAVCAVVLLAQAEADDYDGARRTLGQIGAGRYQDALARKLVKVLADRGELTLARDVADRMQTKDHRRLAYVSILAAYARAGDLQHADALTDRIEGADRQAIARMHLAAAADRAGKTVHDEALPDSLPARHALDAAVKEQLARGLPLGKEGVLLASTVAPRLRAKTYRSLARIQAGARSRRDLLKWIRALPEADSRFYAFLGAGEGFLRQRSPGSLGKAQAQ